MPQPVSRVCCQAGKAPGCPEKGLHIQFPNSHHPDTQGNNVETAVQSSPLNPPKPFTGILPLNLTEQAKLAVKEVLRASYRPSTPTFSDLIDDFVAQPDNLFRGPYLSLDLPYTNADTHEEPFPAVPLGHTPYAHQLEAFQRLQPNSPRSTIIATGTGSGKTECFQLPILDWCHQHADQPGIKAIVIYPMNALAEDQARRNCDPHLELPETARARSRPACTRTQNRRTHPPSCWRTMSFGPVRQCTKPLRISC